MTTSPFLWRGKPSSFVTGKKPASTQPPPASHPMRSFEIDAAKTAKRAAPKKAKA